MTEEQYEQSLQDASDKVEKITDVEWADIISKYNLPLHYDSLRKASQTPWGGSFVYNYFKSKAAFDSGDKKYLKELQSKSDELYKLKRQLFDQRREYNNARNPDARADHLEEQIIVCANRLNEMSPLSFNKTVTNFSDNEAVLVFSDWHYGMTANNIWNTYNTDICKQRVKQLVHKVKTYMSLHNPKKLHIILLGDAAHGAIHTTCRVASEEDVCDQLMQVAEIIAEAVSELSKSVDKTFVYSTYGNHLRTIQNKKDSTHTDNMEKVIPWWIKQRLKGDIDIKVIDSEFQEFIHLNVCGYNIVCCHGDLDNIKNLGVTMNTLFTKLYNTVLDYTLSADKHHLEEFESFGIESIIVRSLCGTDEFADTHRLYSNAGQTLMFFTKEDGRECTYNIKLNGTENCKVTS